MIHSYGDSFTVGLGTDSIYEESLLGSHPNWETLSENDKRKNRKHVHDFRIKNSFTHFFAGLLKEDYNNHGNIGCNNNYIVDLLCNDIAGGEVTDKDTVLINFTSSLRNYPAFLPHFFTSRPERGVEGLSFGRREYDNKNDLEDIGGHLKNTIINKFNGRGGPFYKYVAEYKQTYIKQSFSFAFLDYYNQNLIIFLQNLLSHYGIKYLMFDAFDPTVNTTEVDYTKYINKNKYWRIGKDSIWSFLNNKNDASLLEFKEVEGAQSKKHPSRAGHILFAKELYNLYRTNYGKVLI
tara:strand:- start:472 stop:1350 length:879 start_codon:yes stop_codon:yes gene_type:complete